MMDHDTSPAALSDASAPSSGDLQSPGRHAPPARHASRVAGPTEVYPRLRAHWRRHGRRNVPLGLLWLDLSLLPVLVDAPTAQCCQLVLSLELCRHVRASDWVVQVGSSGLLVSVSGVRQVELDVVARRLREIWQSRAARLALPQSLARLSWQTMLVPKDSEKVESQVLGLMGHSQGRPA
jgi:hypothetical protein